MAPASRGPTTEHGHREPRTESQQSRKVLILFHTPAGPQVTKDRASWVGPTNVA